MKPKLIKSCCVRTFHRRHRTIEITAIGVDGQVVVRGIRPVGIEVSPDERKSAFHLAQASALGYKPANDALRRLSFEYTRDIQ